MPFQPNTTSNNTGPNTRTKCNTLHRDFNHRKNTPQTSILFENLETRVLLSTTIDYASVGIFSFLDRPSSAADTLVYAANGTRNANNRWTARYQEVGFNAPVGGYTESGRFTFPNTGSITSSTDDPTFAYSNLSIGASFLDGENFSAGWGFGAADLGHPGWDRNIEFLVQRPVRAGIGDLEGYWTFSGMFIGSSRTSASNESGFIRIERGIAAFAGFSDRDRYRNNTTMSGVDTQGAFQTAAGTLYLLSADGDTLLFADMTASDGVFSAGVAVRYDRFVTFETVAGRYRTSLIRLDNGGNWQNYNNPTFHTGLHDIDLKLDGTFTLSDLADSDRGTSTIQLSGDWILDDGIITLFANDGSAIILTPSYDGENLVPSSSTQLGSNRFTRLAGLGTRIADPAPLPTDDHPNAGEWHIATPIPVSPTTGTTTWAGVIEIPADTDLFRFTAQGTGPTALRIVAATANNNPAHLNITAYAQDLSQLAISTTFTVNSAAQHIQINAIEGHTYFILVSPDSTFPAPPSTPINYTITLAGPAEGENTNIDPAAAVGRAIAAIDPNGRVVISTTEDGRSRLFLETTNSHFNQDDILAILTGNPLTANLYTNTVSWSTRAAPGSDPNTATLFIAASGEAGTLLIQRAQGGYVLRNLNAELPNAERITKSLTYLETPDGRFAITGLSDSGDLLFYFQRTLTGGPGNAPWAFANLSQSHFRDRGIDPPQFVGELTAYTTPWNARHIAGLDENGHIRQVGWAPTADFGPWWRTSNLSVIAQAPTFAGSVAVVVQAQGQINLVGTTEDGQVVRTYWQVGFGGQWRNENLTTNLAGPAFTPGSLTAYQTPWGTLNIAGVTTAGQVAVYGLNPAVNQNWQAFDLTSNLPNNTPRPVGQLSAATRSGAGLHIVGRDANNDITWLFWRPGMDTWELRTIA